VTTQWQLVVAVIIIIIFIIIIIIIIIIIRYGEKGRCMLTDVAISRDRIVI